PVQDHRYGEGRRRDGSGRQSAPASPRRGLAGDCLAVPVPRMRQPVRESDRRVSAGRDHHLKQPNLENIFTMLDDSDKIAGAMSTERNDIIYPSAIPFVMAHLACVAAMWTGVTWQAVSICILLYWLRIFAIGAGYHRYFSHRAYSTSRLFQFVLAL